MISQGKDNSKVVGTMGVSNRYNRIGKSITKTIEIKEVTTMNNADKPDTDKADLAVYANYMDWQELTRCLELPVNFIRRYQCYFNKVCWENISDRQLPFDFIREFKDKLCWNRITYNKSFSRDFDSYTREDFVREFQDKVDWIYVSKHYKLSESFLREFKDKVNWDIICHNQVLSCEFMEEFQDKVNWDKVSIRQSLTESFIEKFKDKLNMNLIKGKVKVNRTYDNGFLKKHNIKGVKETK